MLSHAAPFLLVLHICYPRHDKQMPVPQRQLNPATSAWAAAIRATESAKPRMVSIPAGWFGMGCEAGRDDEKPLHRVWVDAFDIAAFQVTRADYARFIAATNRAATPFWDDANFRDPQQPVVGPSWIDAA